MAQRQSFVYCTVSWLHGGLQAVCVGKLPILFFFKCPMIRVRAQNEEEFVNMCSQCHV